MSEFFLRAGGLVLVVVELFVSFLLVHYVHASARKYKSSGDFAVREGGILMTFFFCVMLYFTLYRFLR